LLIGENYLQTKVGDDWSWCFFFNDTIDFGRPYFDHLLTKSNDLRAGLINLCVLFLDAQSAQNKGNVNAQNKAYVHSLFFGIWEHFCISKHTKRAIAVSVSTSGLIICAFYF